MRFRNLRAQGCKSRRSHQSKCLEYARNTATTTQTRMRMNSSAMSYSNVAGRRQNFDLSTVQKNAKQDSPSLFGGSMHHLLSGNLLPSAASPGPKEAPPLSPRSKAAEQKKRPQTILA